jgi:DNA mismatch repair ATPase MutS
MHPDRDWAEEPALTKRFRFFRREARPALAVHEQALAQDLAFDTLLSAMAGGDEFLFDAAQRALFSAFSNDLDTIRHRQDVFKDCVANAAIIREFYEIVVETIAGKQKYYIADYARYPSSILYSGIEALQWYAGRLRKLRAMADACASRFASRGLSTLFVTLQAEFDDQYFETIQEHLRRLKFNEGTLISAALGTGNQGTNHVLHVPHDERGWFDRLTGRGLPGFTFYIHERDEAGARAVGEIRDRGINLVANALAQSTEHILSFFEILRAELAFYIACINVHDRLAALGVPTCRPQPEPTGVRSCRFDDLADVCLALQKGERVMGNTLDADGKRVAIITGANQGGKSTFLRSIGLAQVMMQCGMFVGAERFSAELCTGVFTHYKREEDVTMQHGKLDEELARMSAIVDAIKPGAMLLFNESFASTNEVEGSEIARQLVTAMLGKRIKVFFVTHQYEFARSMLDQRLSSALFLRAERRVDGTRTFRVLEGPPLETSYGEDLYEQIFDTAANVRSAPTGSESSEQRAFGSEEERNAPVARRAGG